MAEGHVAGGENDRGRVFRFADFEFDARTVELRRAGAKVRLEGQPLKILQLLLQRPGDLVTREDLRRQLWPSNTIVDFDHGINYAVTRLREALGDSSEAPRFIETLPRRGYRFVHPLNPVRAENPPPAPARYGWHAALLGLAFVLVVLFALNVFGPRERWMASSEPRSIALAVLPLKNLSADPGQDYYADGLTEALITELGKIGRLQVLSSHSVNRYRETSKTLPEIARELRVDVLLEGAVLRSATRVRVTVKLLQAMPERQLLAESYDFDAQDVLALQAEVARDVAARTRVTVTPQEQSRVAAKRRVDPQAYEAYLLARAYSAR